VAYSSSRRIQAASSAAGRSRAGSSRRLRARNAGSSPRVAAAAAAVRGGRPRPWRCQAVRRARSETPSSLRVWLMPTSAARCQAGPAAQPHAVAGGGAGEDAGVVLVGLGAVQGRRQARPPDRTAGADLLGGGGLGGLAGFGEEQLGINVPAGGLQPPIPLPIPASGRWGWAGQLLVGGGEALGQQWLAGLAAEPPGEVADVGVGDAQPAGGVLLVGLPELFDPLGGGRRAGA